jgi:phosphopantothenoylcysteine decarboxylase / phosphopantothenate---cysteine ligase
MNERIILGVTGSIAAYKAVYLLRTLTSRGFKVPVVMTESAQRFVGRVTFEALTDGGVYDDLWGRREALNHISLLAGTSLVLVAPATANIIAKTAHGLADDLLSSLLLAASPDKIMFAPAMNSGMWLNPATAANIALLKERGVRFVEPGSGELACGVTGKGRLADPELISLAAEAHVRSHPLLAGRQVVITCGRTEEEIDPVRVITNRSSGKMGVELARSFARASAKVILVAGQVSVDLPRGIEIVRAFSAAQMLSCLAELEPSTDILIAAAAIGDYSPAQSSTHKIKNDRLTLELTKTPDVLASLSSDRPVRIGFSVDTGDDQLQSARNKLKSKRLDAIVANPSSVIGEDLTQASVIFADGQVFEIPSAAKADVSFKLVEIAARLLQAKGGHD